MRMRGKAGKSKLILFLISVVVAILSGLLCSALIINISSKVYLRKELVNFNVSGFRANSEDVWLVVNNSANTYVHKITNNERLSFLPPRAGSYNFGLLNETGFTYLGSFLVIGQNKSLLSKRVFLLGERIFFDLSGYDMLKNATLVIKAPDTAYRLGRQLRASESFIASKQGDYTVSIYLRSRLIHSESFSVVTESTQHNTSIILINNEGNVKNVRLEKKKLNGEWYTFVMLDNQSETKLIFEGNQSFDNAKLYFEKVPSHLIPWSLGKPADSFALDPTKLNFTRAKLTKIAKGRVLYKCKDYDFKNRACKGEFKPIMTLVPGQKYSITITREDPLWSEQNGSINCQCSDSVSQQNSGSLSCSTVCAVNVSTPANAIDGFIQEVRYNVTVTIERDNTQFTNTLHEGRFDHDTTYDNSNEVIVGNSTSTSTFTAIWTKNDMPSSGSQSFNKLDCSNWNDGYCTYYIYLSTSTDFQAPGRSKKSPSISISLNWINYTWNYSLPGVVTVILNQPEYDAYLNYNTILFNFTPTSNANFVNCTLYTNESGWSIVGYNETITNNTYNFITHTIPNDGAYLWNVNCTDANGVSAFAMSNYTLHIDRVNPVLYLESPADGATWNTSNVVTFVFNVSDTSPISNCSLLIDNEVVSTDTTITKDTSQEIVYTLLNGVYNWSIKCTDAAGNYNLSIQREINVSPSPLLWSGKWYETHTNNFLSLPVSINLANNTDGTTNYVYSTLNPYSTVTILTATSNYIGGNGGYIDTGTTVNFRAYFSYVSGNSLYTKWKFNIVNSSGTFLICEDTVGEEIPASDTYTSGSCTVSTGIVLETTAQIQMVLIGNNLHPSKSRTFNHTIDHADSYIDILGWHNVGYLAVNLSYPTSPVNIVQGENFTVRCNVSCSDAECLDVNVSVEYNATGGWTTVGSSGNIILNGSSNPQSVGNLSNNSIIVSFNLKGNIVSNNKLRCKAVSKTQSATSTTELLVTVGDNEAPIVTLDSPKNNSWLSYSTNVVLYFNTTETSGLDNCSLFIDGEYNTSKGSSKLVNNGKNNFTITSFNNGLYNWSVKCTDVNGLSNTSVVWWFYIDTQAPNVVLNSPGNGSTVNSYTAELNFTATDNLDSILLCNVTIDGSVVNSSVSANSGQLTSVAVSGLSLGLHYWNVTCWDDALNTNTPVTRSFNVTDTPPSVQLYQPSDYGWKNSSTVTLYFNLSDNDGLQNCSLWLDGQKNATKNSSQLTNNALNNFTVSNLSEGLHNWTVNCTDTGNLTAQPSVWHFYVDLTMPAVLLISPVINAKINSTPVDFVFNTTDNLDSTMECNLSLDGTIVSSGISAQNDSQTPVQVSQINDGQHYWNVTCWDNASNVNTSNTNNFNLSVKPQVTQDYPLADTYTYENVTFLFTISDNDGFANCSVFIDNLKNQTKLASELVNNAQNNITVYNLSEGWYNWSVLCYDNGSFANSNQTDNIEFAVDITKPSVQLNYPSQNEMVNSKDINFNFTAFDNLASTLTCNLTVSNGKNATNLVVSNGVAFNKTLYNFTNGVYYWNVSCKDQVGLVNISGTVSFNVSVPPTVTLNYPTYEPFWDNIGINAYFEYFPDSNGVLANCSLIIDGKINRIEPNPVDKAINSFETNISEGYHNWTVRCYDSDGLSGEADAMLYYVDLHAPRIQLNYPLDDSIVDSNFVNYNFTAFDNMAQNLTCNLTVNDGTGAYVEFANLNVTNATAYNVTQKYHDGNYTWNVTCWDLAGNINTSKTNNFTIEAPPEVNLTAPADHSWTSNINLSLSYYAYDPYFIRNCTLWLNSIANTTDIDITNSANNEFNLTNLSDGNYNWTVSCIDADYNEFKADEWFFHIDTHNPWIELNSPADGENLTATPIVLNFTPRDATSYWLLCNITLDGSIIESNVNITENSSYTTNVSSLSEATHYWNVTCVDIVGLSNTSATRSFNFYRAPELTLISPKSGHWSNNATQIFYFNVSDSTGLENCSLLINGSLNATKTPPALINNATNNFTVQNLNGSYTWAVRCYDNTSYFMINESENRSLYIDLYAPTPNIETANFTWFNTTTPTISFNITDNMAPSINYTIYVDNIENKNGTVTTAQSTSIQLDALSDGEHTVVVEAEDLAGNKQNSSAIIIRVDTHKPWIMLHKPPNNNETSSVHVSFNFTAYDAMSVNLSCELYLDKNLAETVNATNATDVVVQHTVSPGTHYWNVTCYDRANNFNTSETWNFTAPAPDLYINSSLITANKTRLEEAKNVMINVTVLNIGGTDASNIVVQLFEGDPDSGGTQIDTNKTISNLAVNSNSTASFIWQPAIGSHNLFAVVDPPLDTNGSIIELNESNNRANKSFTVAEWHIIVGNITGGLIVADSHYNLTFEWSKIRSNNSNIFAADSDSTINWDELAAIGKDLNSNNQFDDFEDIDTKLGTSSLPDSVNATYTKNGQPRAYASFTVYGKTISSVPVMNSTNTSAFVTGILWDYGDGGSSYDGSQDIIFVTKSNLNKTGSYGQYDFELRVPAQLRSYIAPENEVALYLELK